MSIGGKHRWQGPVDDRTCKDCGVRKKLTLGKALYRQWWGGWHPEYPPCAPLEERKNIWKHKTQRAQYEAVVNQLLARVRNMVSVEVMVCSDCPWYDDEYCGCAKTEEEVLGEDHPPKSCPLHDHSFEICLGDQSEY